MTGKIIDFRVRQHLKGARLARQKLGPRGPANHPADRAEVHRQIGRITSLLHELEDTAQGGDPLPQMLVEEARASIERTRRMLQSWPGSATRTGREANGKNAVQPDIDDDLLQRMYRDLGLHT
jgi:hypothetical protein